MTSTIPHWTAWADATVGGQPLGYLTCAALSYGQQLNGFGTGKAVVLLDDTQLTRTDLLAVWTYRVWILYRGIPVWCGLPTGVVDTGAATIELTLTELSGYLTRRVLDVPVTYTQTEQTTIARALATPVTDVGVSLVTAPGPGFPRDRTYDFLEGPTRADLLTNLANVISGPEFRTEYALTAGVPSAVLRIAYPRVGRDQSVSGLGLVVPGTALDFTLTWDGQPQRTRTYAVGDLPDGADATQRKPFVVVDVPRTNTPRLDGVDTWNGTIVVAALREKANAAATVYNGPVLDLTGTVSVDNPPVDTYQVGDSVQVHAEDLDNPAALDVPAVLLGMDVDCTAGTVSWTLRSVTPAPRPRPTLSQTLANLRTRQDNADHRNLAATPS